MKNFTFTTQTSITTLSNGSTNVLPAKDVTIQAKSLSAAKSHIIGSDIDKSNKMYSYSTTILA